MKVSLRKSSLDPSSKKRIGSKHAPGHLSINSPVAPIYNTYIQRKPVCVRAGGCPLCQTSLPIQAKLRIGQPNDKYEQEADRVADKVLRMPEPQVQRQVEPEEEEQEETLQPKPLVSQITPLVQVQRQEEPEEEEEELQAKPLAEKITTLVQRQVEEEEPIMTKGISGSTHQIRNDLHMRLNLSRGEGQTLSEAERSFMESRFGVDFSGVRIHTDSTAIQLSRELNAEAFTHGRDIYFGAGRYNPRTSSGKRFLAHELTHVVQQSEVVKSFSSGIQQRKPNKPRITITPTKVKERWIKAHRRYEVKGKGWVEIPRQKWRLYNFTYNKPSLKQGHKEYINKYILNRI